jgi:uncharacterized protein YabN with tetrapyrrole methylase and pyrophosphatase domain
VPGSLVCVGVGIRAIAETSLSTIESIKHADRAFFAVNDVVALTWLRRLNPNSESLHDLYAVGKLRKKTYAEMVAKIVTAVSDGAGVCAVTYGHPGVFAFPFHESIRRVRALGLAAVMYPAVSAEDCLFADLGFDPSQGGCQSYEASDFVRRRPLTDVRSHLILWQIALIGEVGYQRSDGLWSSAGLRTLIDVLLERYDADHEVIVYESSRHPLFESRVERISLSRLMEANVTVMATLYVPPVAAIGRDVTGRLAQVALTAPVASE